VLNGIYKVTFQSRSAMGEVNLALDNGKIEGSDDIALYEGQYQDSMGKMTASVTLTNLTARVSPVLGVFAKTTLQLAGESHPTTFALNGTLPNNPNEKISVQGQRIGDLTAKRVAK
jgi:uncharacterized protein (DUF608 family)